MIPELKKLICEAQKYLKGEIHYSELINCAASFYNASKFGVHPSVRSLAEDWNEKSLQLWPEFSRVEKISEEEFRDWVKDQLKVLKTVSLEDLQNEINKKKV